jgi:hypothetical protein
MKRTLKGMDAYATILGRELPEKTATYTPISHADVINKVRSEITSAGYIITKEEYRCTNDGDVLSANFLNSYNKQYAFRFALGAVVKACHNGMILNNNKFGSYKRVHKGDADILAEGKIKEFIEDSSEYWESLVEHKDKMKHIVLTKAEAYNVLGKLFYEENLLNTMQLNIVKKEIDLPSFDYKVPAESAWTLYNHITLALKEAHPSSWIKHQSEVHRVFDELLTLQDDTEVAVLDGTEID